MTRTRLAIRTIHEDAAIDKLGPDSGGAGQPPGEAKSGHWHTGTSPGSLSQQTGPVPSTAGSVVVGIDGSPTSRAALRWATREAEHLGAPLTLCHTHSVIGLAGTRRVPASLSEDVLERAVATASGHLGAERVSAILGYGDPARVLAQVSKDARLLSIGTHGYFAHGASLFEPLSMRIISNAPCPVVVHPVLAGPSGPFAGSVVAGVDGSTTARAALEFAAAHALAHQQPLVAVHIAPPSDPWAGNPLLEEPAPGGTAADDLLAAELELASVAVGGVTLASFTGRAVPGLLRAAAGAALLVIGARGSGSGLLGHLGSVAQHMIGNATCPVAVIPGPAA